MERRRRDNQSFKGLDLNMGESYLQENQRRAGNGGRQMLSTFSVPDFVPRDLNALLQLTPAAVLGMSIVIPT